MIRIAEGPDGKTYHIIVARSLEDIIDGLDELYQGGKLKESLNIGFELCEDMPEEDKNIVKAEIFKHLGHRQVAFELN
jgi:hypothetical protein